MVISESEITENTEEEIMRTTSDRDSLHEIESKQNPGATRGLLHIKDSVYQFFTALNNQVQTQKAICICI